MTERKIKLEYGGSVGWLIFWMIVFFPVGLVLFATGGKFDLGGKSYWVKYDGSRNWLCFWTLVCFPVTFALLLLNGVSLVEEEGRKSSRRK